MTSSVKRKKSLLLILILSLVISVIPFDSVFAVKETVDPPKLVTRFSSGDNLQGNNITASVENTRMKISFESLLPASEYRISLYRIKPYKGIYPINVFVPAEQKYIADNGRLVYGFDKTLNFRSLDVEDGEYFIYISRIENPGDEYDSGPRDGSLYAHLPFSVKKGKPMIMKYPDVLEENRRVRDIGEGYDPSWYLDEYLNDIDFTLKIPATTIKEPMTSYMVDFMRRMSDQITAGAFDDYDKLLKIYEYVTSEFYYDSVAFQTHSYQYANPYKNLYNHVNHIASENSDSYGRVATTCQGYSAIFTSLARAQGIPTRFVYGHRVTNPLNNWSTEQNIKVKDHWWVESYVNGRWIFIDPTTGTNNRWNKNTNTWEYYGLTNHTYFDPSDDQIAIGHIYHNIYPDKRFGYLINDPYELSMLTDFLETYTDYTKNGNIMNPAYSRFDIKTWGDGYKYHFMGDGYGNTTTIQWSHKGFKGEADFSGFSKLSKLSMHHNELEYVNLSDCESLEKVYLYNNKLKDIDLSNCPSLKYASVTSYNRLKNADIYINGRNRNISAGDNGGFQIKLDRENRRPLQVRGKPNIGYKVKGFYNGSGKELYDGKTYDMNPGYKSYRVLFELDPSSYEYDLVPGEVEDDLIPYGKAAQKRLIALGYYSGPVNGNIQADMKLMIQKFQLANKTETTGIIDEATWSKLFSNNAVPLLPDEVLAEIYKFNNLNLDLSKEATTDKVILNWSLTDEYGLPYEDPEIRYEVWKSSSRDGKYSRIGTTSNMKFTNRSYLKQNHRYYYKVRAVKTIDSRNYYSEFKETNTKLKPVKHSKPAKKGNTKKSDR